MSGIAMGQGEQAKMLKPAELKRLLDRVSHTRHPQRDRVTVLLSFKAGLRAKEIAGLTSSMITDPSGELAETIGLPNRVSKGKGGGRTIPLHRELRQALTALKALRGERVRPKIFPSFIANVLMAIVPMPSPSGFGPAMPRSALREPRHIPADGPSLPRLPERLPKPAAACAMSSNWLATSAWQRLTRISRPTLPPH